MFDCAPISDGAAAVVICPLEKAKEYTDSYVKVSAVAQASDTLALFQRDDITRYNATAIAARNAYKLAGIEASDINVAEVHDNYTVSGINAGVKVTVLEQSDSVYGTAVSDIQGADMELIGTNFKGTSKWLSTGTVASDWGAGNFIAIDFEDLPEEADKIMVGLEPSMGSGMVELTPDDTKSVFKIADKDLQSLVIKTSIGTRTITQTFSLKGVTCQSS